MAPDRGWFGVRGVQATPVPHLSLLAFRDYEPERMSTALARVARRHSAFRVHAHGYGFFCGQTNQGLTLHVPVVRTEELSVFQASVRYELPDSGEPVDGFYEPENWSPHMTLTDRDLTPGLLGNIVTWLATRPHRSWTIGVSNLSLVHDTRAAHEVKIQVGLGRPARTREDV